MSSTHFLQTQRECDGKCLPVAAAGVAEVALPGALELCLGLLADHVDGALAVHDAHDAVRRQLDVTCSVTTNNRTLISVPLSLS